MKHRPNSDEAQKRQIALIEELANQSDRGAAIVGAAWVEEAIAYSLHEVLEKDDRSWKRLFGPAAPLSTFSAKIDLARLLGLMTDTIRTDLHVIRDIRNEFAHQIAHRKTHDNLSFRSQHLQDKCLALKCVAHEGLSEPRLAFTRACAVLSADFELLPLFWSCLGNEPKVFAKVENRA
ncbi:MAG: hypothetical protein AW08_02779 [Candidatus Accumulibacter adjunctus]|uniref:Uncharacterized protein n=1 Tax=Candidatus Accumulibacter adjunctus TaxID=1454001 RepID=A0A011NNP3_9PROT|nr:MAG: hypothetical protein AW08_02779 [Candidatus Accumulibacter adjunctus]